ncbi:MAG: hypothetical protein K0R52_766 [Alphaproteobacteria bacterium]|jgi:hypothetical protein|nr:hypothetical protein [Alphaproteobacteria bacterium]
MRSIREKIERSLNKKTAQDLYFRYMTLALETRRSGDRVLFERYYQSAEYYLHLMNTMSDSSPIASRQMAESPQQATVTVLPLLFNGSFFHRNKPGDVHRKRVQQR